MKVLNSIQLLLCVLFCFCYISGTIVTIQSNPPANGGIVQTELENTVSLTCVVDMTAGGGELQWYRNGIPVSLRDGNCHEQSSLCVEPVTRGDNGAIFTCQLKTNASVNDSIQLEVNYGPDVNGSEEVLVEEKSDVVLSCDIRAHPPVTVVWKKADKLLDLSTGGYRTSSNGIRSDLSILNAKRNVHQGLYTCETTSSIWESLQMNQKTSAVKQMTRSAKNSIGNAYQRFQKNKSSREECLVRTPGRPIEGEENDGTTAHTPKHPASRTNATPRRTPRSSSKRTPRPTRTPETSDSAVRALRPGASRRQLVRMAALRSPFASPNTMNRRRQFDQDLDCVAKGLTKLKRLSQAFDDIIGRDDRTRAMERYKTAMVQARSSSRSSVSGPLNTPSIRQRTRRMRQRVGSWTDGALSNLRKAT